jgi:hypothetical protein
MPVRPWLPEHEQVGWSAAAALAQDLPADVHALADLEGSRASIWRLCHELGDAPAQCLTVHIGQRQRRRIDRTAQRRRGGIDDGRLTEHVQDGDRRVVPARERRGIAQRCLRTWRKIDWTQDAVDGSHGPPPQGVD